MKISIIIPTYNEEANIEKTLDYIKKIPNQELIHELIVVDGGSTDATIEIAQKQNVKVLQISKKGRANQMNFAASKSTGEVLYFVHADVLPPKTGLLAIQHAIGEGKDFGCFAFQFDSDSKLLKINSLCTKRDGLFCGGGDQTLFMKKNVFQALKGYKEYPIMEDFDLVWRAKKTYQFTLIPENALVSARKYKHNSYLKVQIVNLLIFLLFKANVAPDFLAKLYKKFLT